MSTHLYNHAHLISVNLESSDLKHFMHYKPKQVSHKGKGSSLDIVQLTILDSGALQPRKWQLIGTGCSTAGTNGLLDLQYAASRHTMPQSTTLGLHPVIHAPNYMNHYSFTNP